MEAAEVQVPWTGSKISALACAPPLRPPAASTVPVASSVADCNKRAAAREPVADQVLDAGLNMSALDRGVPLLSRPAATSTLPLPKSVAVWSSRVTVRPPTVDQVLLPGS